MKGKGEATEEVKGEGRTMKKVKGGGTEEVKGEPQRR